VDKRLIGKDTKKILGAKEAFYILISVIAMQVHSLVKMHPRGLGMVSYAHNPSYLGGRGREILI
jgi:hypothetical protein